MADDSATLLTPSDFLPQSSPNSSLTLSDESNATRKMTFSPNRATPAVLGPSNPALPDFKRNKKGDLILQKWTDSELSSVEFANRENRSRVKVEVDCARFKLAAEDAQKEAQSLRLLLRQSEENAAQIKIKLNDERARHAETADQARALTHVAAQLRTKTEKYETIISNQTKNMKKFQTANAATSDKLKLQDARVDALARICAALEQQLRDRALDVGTSEEAVDIAAMWRQKAYKAMVQLNHTENRLTTENNALRRSANRTRPLPQSPLNLAPPSPNHLPPPEETFHTK